MSMIGYGERPYVHEDLHLRGWSGEPVSGRLVLSTLGHCYYSPTHGPTNKRSSVRPGKFMLQKLGHRPGMGSSSITHVPMSWNGKFILHSWSYVLEWGVRPSCMFQCPGIGSSSFRHVVPMSWNGKFVLYACSYVLENRSSSFMHVPMSWNWKFVPHACSGMYSKSGDAFSRAPCPIALHQNYSRNQVVHEKENVRRSCTCNCLCNRL